ncbi:MAG: cytochrome c [Phaeovulum sp.]|uniref:c-type cytochrome n=1 Tax=Phaeovulum sp. TaxID=2934796 RepID=UPI0027323CB4|nr:c-type cytochrome [Phaeovulum sp.]MDP3861806.1 cytochrome c [Phaeovulum sp.]
MFRSFVVSVSILAFLGLGSVAQAQMAEDEYAAGRAEYMAACAACHGEALDGNGPIAIMFSGKVPRLTQLAKANDGVFPTLTVFQTIDGRAKIKAHGDPMPLFGNRYTVDNPAAGTYGSEAVVRARILELVYFLQSVQE